AAEGDGEPRAALAEHVEARPLLSKEHRMAVHERREASDAETNPPRDGRQRREHRHRLQPRLGEQAVADPDGVEDLGRLGGLRLFEQVARLDRAQHDGAVSEAETQRLCHGYRPRYCGGRFSTKDLTPSSYSWVLRSQA